MLDVKLHDIGEGMTEGEILQYLVQVGDQVAVDQPLVEVQTDKVVAELPSPCSGIVKEIIIETGETVQVGTSLLSIEEEFSAEIGNKPLPKREATNEVAATVSEKVVKPSPTPFRRVLAAPYTRKIARENNINIEDVPSSDPSGRVTEEDIYRFIEGKQAVMEPIIEVQPVSSYENPPHELPFRGIRKQIAKKMTQSYFTIPHVTHFDEVNMTRLINMRDELKMAGESVSLSAFFIKALTIALKEFPIFNAELDEDNDRILLKKNYHIGIATNTDNGLLVPVVHDADKKTIKEIHRVIKDLTEKAITGRLKPSEMQNSTFTMSNVGPLGSTGATPMINHPETAIIAFHKTKKQPIVNEHDEIVIGHVMTLSMSFDHRVADGATAVAFTNRFSGLLEQPHNLLLEMI
ncbi:2-oxo acid dehydrogenase subunit E2 [Sporosarcina luteola]|uniref:dihydrolipoamide acetyltransferase family protein n=1 Tax=Bacillales TaxID=1385 RepID=UPI00203E288B|nr:dihydrolipoamide acetyltransferase family protein [Saccharococcus sp. Marseille-Q5394]MCM3636722.1 2-oxo acid dehydrogenase subunit E2 [Sporosarcina luteola]